MCWLWVRQVFGDLACMHGLLSRLFTWARQPSDRIGRPSAHVLKKFGKCCALEVGQFATLAIIVLHCNNLGQAISRYIAWLGCI